MNQKLIFITLERILLIWLIAMVLLLLLNKGEEVQLEEEQLFVQVIRQRVRVPSRSFVVLWLQMGLHQIIILIAMCWRKEALRAGLNDYP